MKTGDHVILVITEKGKENRWIMKHILVDGEKVFAITNMYMSQGWPERLQLRRERLEELPMLLVRPPLYVYQDDVSHP